MNEFITHVSYFCTWIGGFGIWKSDFSVINDFSRKAHLQLTQTDVLFRLIPAKGAIVVNTPLFTVVELTKKGDMM